MLTTCTLISINSADGTVVSNIWPHGLYFTVKHLVMTTCGWGELRSRTTSPLYLDRVEQERLSANHQSYCMSTNTRKKGTEDAINTTDQYQMIFSYHSNKVKETENQCRQEIKMK